MIENRSRIDPPALPTPLCDANSGASVLGAVPNPLERLWGEAGTLLDGSWPLLARPGRPKIGFGTEFGRPKTVLSASGCIPKTALGARNGPRSIFRSIWLSFSWIFVRFFIDFHRIGISKRSRMILTARLGSCIAQWLRTAHTSFELHVTLFSLFSLRTHQPT